MMATPLPTYRLKITDVVAVHRRKELHRIVVDAVENGSRRVVLDCESLSDFDLMLVSTLVNCATTCSERGADFCIENLRDDLQERIAALQLHSRIQMTTARWLEPAAVS